MVVEIFDIVMQKCISIYKGSTHFQNIPLVVNTVNLIISLIFLYICMWLFVKKPVTCKFNDLQSTKYPL